MKAFAVFPQARNYRVITDHPEPRIESAAQIKLRMLEVGICGTDKEIASFLYGDPPAGSDYLVLGHESLGEVVETGSEVSDIAKGDLVVFSVRRPCPHPYCVACRAGRQDFCYTGDFTERGIKGHHGYIAEYVVDDVRYANKVPADLRDIAVLVEPLTIAEKGVIQLWGVQQRLPWACPVDLGESGPPGWCHKALVLGAGPVGLLGAMKMVLEGFETYIYSRISGVQERVDIANAIGAKFIDSDKVGVDEMSKMIGNIDVVYEAVGATKLAFHVLEHLGTNAVFIFTGVPGHRESMSIETGTLLKAMVLKNQILYGTVNAGPQAFHNAIEDLAEFRSRWPDAIRSVITHRIPMESAGEAVSGDLEGIKNVISIS